MEYDVVVAPGADSTTGLVLDLYPGDPLRWSVVAILTGVPASPTLNTTATITVGGGDVTTYRYALDGGPWSADRPVATPIVLSQQQPALHALEVVGRSGTGACQAAAEASTATWRVAPWPLGGVNDLLLEKPYP